MADSAARIRPVPPRQPGSLAEALAAFQADIPRIEKTQAAIIEGESKTTGKKFTYGYKYADLANVTAIVLPLLGKHGLSFNSCPKMTANGFVLLSRLRHVSGDSDEAEWPLPDPTRTKPRDVASMITYARRYSLYAMTGIAPDDEDDDAEAAKDTRAEYKPETRADGSATDAELERMNRGPVPGTERLNSTPPDDPWYGTERTDRTPREELPGTAIPAQLRKMHALFKNLGIDSDQRDERLALTREIVGREIQSANALSFVDAQTLNAELEKRVKEAAVPGDK